MPTRTFQVRYSPSTFWSDEQESDRDTTSIARANRLRRALRKCSAPNQVIRAKELLRFFDVFLSYNSVDRTIVSSIANQLRRLGLRAWFDRDHLIPGKSWVADLQQAISQIACAAVFIGQPGIGQWEEAETEAFLLDFVRRHKRIIPVLLPTACDHQAMPAFLCTKTWVDMRSTESPDDALYRLVCGIINKAPLASTRKLTARQVWMWQSR